MANKDKVMEPAFLVSQAATYLTGVFEYSGELQAFWMAVEGSMTVRKGLNKNGNLHWFHAFCLSVAAGFTGGWLGFFLMGLPSSMLFNDINSVACIAAFILVNYTPFDLGYKLLDTLPCQFLTVAFAQLFRSTAIAKFSDVCNSTFSDKASSYYPMVVFGPILYPTLLGNWGGFLMNGFQGYLEQGMPWGFQNGFFVSTLYHFFLHDEAGPIGIFLRQHIAPLAVGLGLDNHTFGVCFVSGWMLVMGVLRMPLFYGPTFTPFAKPRLFSSTPSKRRPVEVVPTKTMGRQAQPKQKKKKSKSKAE